MEKGEAGQRPSLKGSPKRTALSLETDAYISCWWEVSFRRPFSPLTWEIGAVQGRTITEAAIQEFSAQQNSPIEKCDDGTTRFMMQNPLEVKSSEIKDTVGNEN